MLLIRPNLSPAKLRYSADPIDLRPFYGLITPAILSPAILSTHYSTPAILSTHFSTPAILSPAILSTFSTPAILSTHFSTPAILSPAILFTQPLLSCPLLFCRLISQPLLSCPLLSCRRITQPPVDSFLNPCYPVPCYPVDSLLKPCYSADSSRHICRLFSTFFYGLISNQPPLARNPPALLSCRATRQ